MGGKLKKADVGEKKRKKQRGKSKRVDGESEEGEGSGAERESEMESKKSQGLRSTAIPRRALLTFQSSIILLEIPL